MSGVAIQATFGKDQKPLNGLESIVEDLLDKPLQEHYVIAKVRTAYTKTDYDNGGTETPTVKFVHIEPMLSDNDEAAARKLFEQACKARLGELPQQTLFEDGSAGAAAAGEDGEEFRHFISGWAVSEPAGAGRGLSGDRIVIDEGLAS